MDASVTLVPHDTSPPMTLITPSPGQPMTIGRSRKCDIVLGLRTDSRISRVHFELRCDSSNTLQITQVG